VKTRTGADSVRASLLTACSPDGWDGPDQRGRRSHPAPKLSRECLAEWFLLTARTEVTNLMLIFSECHLRPVPRRVCPHYNGRQPPRSRQLRPDESVADLSQEWAKRCPVLGDLIYE
jgi:hypothetical protein